MHVQYVLMPLFSKGIQKGCLGAEWGPALCSGMGNSCFSFAFLLLLIWVLANTLSGMMMSKANMDFKQYHVIIFLVDRCLVGSATQLQSMCVSKKWERNAKEKEGGSSCWNM